MNEAEAREACARLAREHPERETHRWRPREEADRSWSVVKIALPSNLGSTAETRAEGRPPTADDPRTAAMRDLGPNVGPGI
jgi:hypothetical protein